MEELPVEIKRKKLRNKFMYYSLSYIDKERKAFASISNSDAYSSESLKKVLKVEGEFVVDISDKFFQKQGKIFPYGIIRDFLSVYPKLSTTNKTRYDIEKEFLLRALDDERYLIGSEDVDIEMFNEYYTKGYDIGGETALKDTKVALGKAGTNMQRLGSGIVTSFNLTDPVVRSKLKWDAGRRITGINETTRRLIINNLISSYDSGEGYDGMKKNLKDLFESWKVPKSEQWFTNKRAEMIARTELGQAISWAREESYTRRDVRHKSWLAEPKACPLCLIAVRDGSIAFKERFSNNFSGPLAHPNCRCALLPEVNIEDYLQGYTWHGEAQNQVHTQT